MDNKTILVLAGRYLPGVKDGGGMRSIVNLVAALGTDYKFQILALDRDHGDVKAYDSIKHDQWNRVGNADVWYARPEEYNSKLIYSKAKQADLIYVCGCYNNYALSALWLNRVHKINKPLIIAAMGNFSPAALSVKKFKKELFFRVGQQLNLFKGVIWSCTSEEEQSNVIKILGDKTKCLIAQDLPQQILEPNPFRSKVPGAIKICFISRIVKIKNLDFAVDVINHVKGNIEFTIYGILEDKSYWEECLIKLKNLPENIKWSYCGILHPDQVMPTMKTNHLYFLPTKGENFGHTIFEALASGCIVVISDKTPWKDLELMRAGWALPLNRPEVYQDIIQSCVDMDQKDYVTYSDNAYQYALEKQKDAGPINQYRNMFDSLALYKNSPL